jgi:hypothetical protein
MNIFIYLWLNNLAVINSEYSVFLIGGLTLQRPNFFKIIHTNLVRTSQETHYISAIKLNRVMLFKETIAVYCESHTKHTNTLCGQNSEFWCAKLMVHTVTNGL